ncbi:MAG: hypothetical protein HY234_12280 [Acidobacteria bacterium]|nr:hypothetical protein [Acidobacteriota bacterium]
MKPQMNTDRESEITGNRQNINAEERRAQRKKEFEIRDLKFEIKQREILRPDKNHRDSE